MNDFKLTEKKVNAFVIHDKHSDTHTIFLDGIAGGPVVSGSTVEEAKEKFNEALRLSGAVRNFLFFTQAVKANNEVKAPTKKIFDKGPAIIEYIETELDMVC